jgi:hypothetical protein
MITNNSFYEILGQIPSEHRSKIKYRRNPKWVQRGERDFMFRELPQNPLRIVEYAAEVAKDSLLWDDVEWGMDSEGCWVKQRFVSQRDKNYLELIESGHPRHEAEVFAALRLLASVLKDRNI